MPNKSLFLSLLFTIASSHFIFTMEPSGNQEVTIHQTSRDKDKLEAQQSCINKQLIAAAQKGNTQNKIMQLLIQGGKVDARDETGRTPLMLGAHKGLDEICQILIDFNAHIDARDNESCTALMNAACYGHESICELLINHGAQVNAQDIQGDTALTVAAYNGHISICKILLDNGAQFEAKNNKGYTVLRRVVKWDHRMVIETLITYPIFSPFLSEDEFQSSRQGILTALCAFKRICPSLPKDMRKLILCLLPELKKDVSNCGIFGNFKNLTEEQTPHVPLPIVRLLIEKGKLDPDKTIAAIKAHHLLYISPYCSEAMPFATTPEKCAFLHPDNLEQNFGFKIEWNIRRRLGLPLTWADSVINMIPESCSVQ